MGREGSKGTECISILYELEECLLAVGLIFCGG